MRQCKQLAIKEQIVLIVPANTAHSALCRHRVFHVHSFSQRESHSDSFPSKYIFSQIEVQFVAIRFDLC